MRDWSSDVCSSDLSSADRYAVDPARGEDFAGYDGDGADDENNPEENKTNLVKVQKSWFRKTPSFSYKLEEDDDGRTVMRVDLEPKIGGGARAQIWDYSDRKSGV